ncbi:hypothetical protein [Candidatus Vidania fulgoroideorum]
MKLNRNYIFNFLDLLTCLNSKKKKYSLSINFINNKLIFFFKNFDNKVLFTTKYKNNENDSFFLNFEKIKNLLKSVNNNELLNIIKKKKKLYIKNNNFEFITNLKKKKNNSFIFLNFFNNLNSFIKIEKNELLKALNYNLSTLKIIGNKDTGLNILIKKKKIVFYSTDGFRMSYFFTKIINKKEIKINISKDVVLFIIKFIKKKNPKNIYLKFKKNKIFFCVNDFFFISKECKQVTITSQLIKNYKKFIKIKINYLNFYNAVKRVSCISTEKNNWLDMKIMKKKLFIEFNDLNEIFKEKINIDNKYTIKKIRININFLIDFLKHKKSDYFFIYIKNRFEKIIMKYEKSNFKYLIMPIYY